MRKLVNFVSQIKSGARNVKAPVYSHLTYDIVPDEEQVIDQPDILILEGLNVLQSDMLSTRPHHVFVSDFVDFSIYVDAAPELLKQWYIGRFLKFRQGAFSDLILTSIVILNLGKEAINIASSIWDEINGLNLEENILPTKERASLIMTKGENHSIQSVRLRK